MFWYEHKNSITKAFYIYNKNGKISPNLSSLSKLAWELQLLLIIHLFLQHKPLLSSLIPPSQTYTPITYSSNTKLYFHRLFPNTNLYSNHLFHQPKPILQSVIPPIKTYTSITNSPNPNLNSHHLFPQHQH